MGLRNTILEDGLEQLLEQCPDITLDARSIKLIIESGTFDQVISEYKGVVPLEEVGNDIPTSSGKIDTIRKIIKKPKKKKQALDK